MALADYDWTLLARTVGTMVGVVVLLAGASTLLALLVFPASAVEGGSPLAALSPFLQALAAVALLMAGAGIVYGAVAGPVRTMWEVRRREGKGEGPPPE